MITLEEYERKVMQAEHDDEMYGQGRIDGFLDGRLFERQKVLKEIIELIESIKNDYANFAEEHQLEFALAASNGCAYVLEQVKDIDREI